MHGYLQVASPSLDPLLVTGGPFSALLIGTGVAVLLVRHAGKLGFRPASQCITVVVQRSLDIVAAAAAIVLLLPVLVVCAVGIKLSSRGPVLLRQLRTSNAGHSFACFRFRTERISTLPQHTAHPNAHRAQSGDPSFTRIGRLLHRFRLDDLPQVFNMLLGDIRITDPRPIPAEGTEVKKRQRR